MGWEWVCFWAQNKEGKPFAGSPRKIVLPSVGQNSFPAGKREVTVEKNEQPTLQETWYEINIEKSGILKFKEKAKRELWRNCGQSAT